MKTGEKSSDKMPQGSHSNARPEGHERSQIRRRDRERALPRNFCAGSLRPDPGETAARLRNSGQEPKNRAEKLSVPGKESLPRNGGQNKISLLATVLPSFCRANRSPPAAPPLRTESRSPSKDWLT